MITPLNSARLYRPGGKTETLKGIIMDSRRYFDMISVLIALTTVLLLLRFKKLQEPFIILAAAIIGVLIKGL